jgi:proline iminopeptidase
MHVTVNGVRLFLDVINPQLEIVSDGLQDKPTLVCLPGGPGGDHQTLRPFVDRFANVAQVVYLDHRASGRSERGDPTTWTLDQWGDDVAAYCDALGIVKPLVLGGSGGALVAQAYLSGHPHHAGGAVLVNPCARMVRDVVVAGFEKLGGPEAGAAARAMYTRGAPEDVPAFFKYCLPFYSQTRNFAALQAGSTRTTFDLQVSQHFFHEGGEAFRFDHRNALGQVSCPVLLLAGAHDPVTRAEWGTEVAAALPAGGGELVIFEDSSHILMADEPERLTQCVEAFLAAR